MNCWWCYAVWLIVTALIWSVPVCRAQSDPRNIIILITDDQRWDTLGVTGNPVVRTPNIDRLADRGVIFDNTFVTTSICATSRASIFTGQYARRHGIWDFRTELTPDQLNNSYLGRLREAGYFLGFIGKWGVGDPPQDFFDFDRAFSGQGRYRLEVNGEERHLTSVMGDQVVEFLSQLPEDRPFCLSVSFKAAHVQDSYDLSEDPFPYDPTLSSLYQDIEIPTSSAAEELFFARLPDFLKDSENRKRWAVRFWGPGRYQESVKGYYRLISGVDRVVGRLTDTLEERGLSGSTLILYSSDNGFFLGEFGLAGKWTPHEVSIRVPLILFDPGLKEEFRGRRVSQIALNIDIAPTVVEAAGLAPGSEMQGRSLLPLMCGQTVKWREELFYEHLFRHPMIPPTEGVRTRDWKYIRYLESEPLYEELYDLRSDPQELSNRAYLKPYAAQLRLMREIWSRLREQVR